MASNRKFTFHHNNQNRTNNQNSNNNNNFNRPHNPPTTTTTTNNTNANNQDNDEDFLDISDTELIRASQAVESQMKFTNNVHPKTSNALNIFSQFTSDAAPQSQFASMSQMQAPSMTIMGHPTTAIGGSQFSPVDTFSQLETTKCELKEVKDANMQKEGEVKILRDKLKKQDQEMQRVRNEKLELLKKLQTQQVEAKKHLEKQIEFKELESQFKCQELIEMQMKCKQLEAKLKKSQNTVNPPLNSFPAPTSKTPTSIEAHNFQQQMNSQSIFDEEFSRKKGSSQNIPPSLLVTNKGHGIKRLAQNSAESLFQDEENENPGHESKRPSLGLANSNVKEEKHQQQVGTVIQQPTNVRSHLSSITNTNSPANPSLQAINDLKKDMTKTTTAAKQQPSSVTFLQGTPVSMTPQAMPKKAQKPQPELKRSAKLNLKSFHAIKNTLNKKVPVLDVSESLESLEDEHMANSGDRSNKSNISNDALKVKSRTNEKIYKLIDLFAESASNLEKFNSTTLKNDAYDEESTFLLNSNSTNLNVSSLTKQLGNLLGYMSYKSAASPISSDLFSSFITASLTESTISTSSSANNSLLIIDRVEFVSNKLKGELVNIIKYCLNASFTMDGHVSANLSTNDNSNGVSSNKFEEPRPLPSLLSFTTIHPSIVPSCNSTENLRRLIHNSKNKPTPATNHSLVDLLCNSYEVCVSLFLFLSSLLLINYSQNELNKRSYKLMKSKQLTKSHQPIIYEKLVKLKQDFFRLTNYILKSINFSTSSINFDVESSTNQNAYDLLSSLSTSSTPYSTLKILNTVLDSLNHLIYLPVLNQQSDPNSIMTWFYFSLADNIHNIFRKRINLNQLIELYQESGTTNENKSEMKMDEDMAVDGDEPMIIEIDPKGTDILDFDNKFDEDDEPCLLQLFYEKLVKYFGDVVYTLEACEARQQNSIDDNPSIIIANSGVKCGDDENSIITTIASDENESNKRVLNFNLENKTPTPILQHSKSQTELQYELLQSQVSAEETKNKSNNKTPNKISNASSTLKESNNSSNHMNTYRKYLYSTNSDCIYLLQTKLLNKYIYFLQNFQLIAGLESEFGQLHAKAKGGKNKNTEFETHGKKCSCYKDMMNSFIILVDYQFNEKFYYGADLNFDELFMSNLSSDYLFFPNQKNKGESGNELDRENRHNLLIEETKKILRPNKQSKCKQKANTVCNLNEKTSQFMFMLIMRCLYTLNSIFKNKDRMFHMEQQKQKFCDTIRDDYRLQNFYCLYMLADLIYENFQASSEANCAIQIDRSTYSAVCMKNSANHLYTSMNTLRSMFKVDEYFQLDQDG